jgi:DNA-binding CsgD family transcriptional regulator
LQESSLLIRERYVAVTMRQAHAIRPIVPQIREGMNTKQGAEHTRREIIRLCHAGLDSRALRDTLLRRLQAVIPFDVACFATADPATLLFTDGVTDAMLERVLPQLLENEFLQQDVNKFAWLARSGTPVGVLSASTQHRLDRSPRYRDILGPLALGDELRAALVANTACWGFLTIFRERSRPPFSAAEASFLARLTPHLAEGLRTALLLSRATAPTLPDGPGVLVLADDLSVQAVTPAAAQWLAELGAAATSGVLALPHAVAAVVARLRSIERESDPHRDLLPKVRLRTPSGHWLVLHAARLLGPSGHGPIAVIVEVARPIDIAPLIVQAYDLSKREGEITQLVLRGVTTSEIATTFHISPHTVQDHLKAIFEKVGVRSRRELVGRVFAPHDQPGFAAGAHRDGDEEVAASWPDLHGMVGLHNDTQEFSDFRA